MIVRLLPFIYTLTFALPNFFYANNVDTISIPKVDSQNYESLIGTIVKHSSSYQDYKLIKKSDIEILKTAYQVEEAGFKNAIIELQSKINTIEADNEVLVKQNKALLDKYNALVEETKGSSSGFFIITISALLLILVYFIYKYNTVSDLYKVHRNSIDTVELEFEEYKRSAIEREQKIKRELINLKNNIKSNNSLNGMHTILSIESNLSSVDDKIDLDELIVKGIDVTSANDAEIDMKDDESVIVRKIHSKSKKR